MQARGDYPTAERIYREAYVIRQRIFEEAHPDRAASLTKLGAVLYDQGRYVEAEPLLDNALAIIRPAFGEQNNLVTEALYYMGSIRLARQDVRGADSLLTAALAIWQRHLPDIKHPTLARTLDRLGQMRLQVGDTEAADSLLQQASAMRRALEEIQGNRP
jgi:tetratricopeptide (TPR) repeat protein